MEKVDVDMNAFTESLANMPHTNGVLSFTAVFNKLNECALRKPEGNGRGLISETAMAALSTLKREMNDEVEKELKQLIRSWTEKRTEDSREENNTTNVQGSTRGGKGLLITLTRYISFLTVRMCR